ncbi:MAG TPA: phytanoyl-CoA dioxygenase family protein [Armatimonadota bacterium]|jgi:hypothetical protein
MLTKEQIEQYRTEGYTIVRNVLPQEPLLRLRAVVDDLIAHLPPDQRPEHMDMPHLKTPALLEACRHPALLDAAGSIVGPNIVLFASHLIAKAKGDGLEVPWHQDAEYWELEPMEVATLWLAVDESTVENGCMRVLPGTHKAGLVPHRAAQDKDSKVLDKGVDMSPYDLSKAVNIELAPGDCSFHAPYLLHGSTANHSQKRRCGYTMRYMPASTRLVRDGQYARYFKDHPIFLLRGSDPDGVNEYAEPCG